MTPSFLPTPHRARLDFRALYQRYFLDVSRWIRALGGPESDREDLVQDVFMVVHRRLHDFDGENPSGWLYQITRHRVRDYRRLFWTRHRPTDIASLSEDSLRDAGSSPGDQLLTARKRATLQRVLYTLKESERVALLLFEVEGYRGEEVAKIQGVAVNTAWSRIHRAKKKLRVSLGNDEGKRAPTG